MSGWLAKEQNGKEVIFRRKPHRMEWVDRKHGMWSDAKTYWCDGHNCWGTGHMGYSQHETRIILPKGSIKKLIGRELSWKDEPVKFK